MLCTYMQDFLEHEAILLLLLLLLLEFLLSLLYVYVFICYSDIIARHVAEELYKK